jgi:hypothetical protein
MTVLCLLLGAWCSAPMHGMGWAGQGRAEHCIVVGGALDVGRSLLLDLPRPPLPASRRHIFDRFPHDPFPTRQMDKMKTDPSPPRDSPFQGGRRRRRGYKYLGPRVGARRRPGVVRSREVRCVGTGEIEARQTRKRDVVLTGGREAYGMLCFSGPRRL